MRTGIVGGGGAGLAAAYLVEEAHAVTLVEGEARPPAPWRSTVAPSSSRASCIPWCSR